MSLRFPLAVAAALGLSLAVVLPAKPADARPAAGAELGWSTYEAESMRTNGVVLVPKYDPFLVETEASGQSCVKLAATGEYVEFRAAAPANALVLRFNLPDAPHGGGTAADLHLMINGERVRSFALTSRNAWLYGPYPFTNRPEDGKPRNFYDEVRAKDLAIRTGDIVRLEMPDTQGVPCIIDLVDLEQIEGPRQPETNALSLADFGAAGTRDQDATEALRRCIAAAQERSLPIYVPPGEYTISGDIVVPSNVTLRGAGLWHTTFVGDARVYEQAERRVRFKLSGRNIHLSDFAITGCLNYRNDQEPNDGIVGAGCADSSVRRIWIEHTKAGVWVYNGTRLTIESCRFRNLLADGVNLCVGTSDSIVDNCSARGTGDDCFAIWPAPEDQGHDEQAPKPGRNVIRRSTGQLTFLANGAAIYGGESNRIEHCVFTDISTGCGILISTTFPTSNETRSVDNNFSGTTVVENCTLLRCGGFDHSWAWRGSLQICLDRRSLSGLTLKDVSISESFSAAMTVVAPGSAKGEGLLSNVRVENLQTRGSGTATNVGRGLWIRSDARGSLSLLCSEIETLQNDSAAFTVERTDR